MKCWIELSTLVLALSAPALAQQCGPPAGTCCPPGTMPLQSAPSDPYSPEQLRDPMRNPMQEPFGGPTTTPPAQTANPFSAASTTGPVAPNMVGDLLGGGGVFTHIQGGPSENSHVGLYSFHTFKIAEDESPWPRNRVYFNANSFNNVPGTEDITRLTLGGERTFWDDRASIGLRLPFWLVNVEETPTTFPTNNIPFGQQGFSSDVGDLTMTLKTVLYQSGYEDLLTAGLSVTFPTGPATLGGVEPFYQFNDVRHRGTIQPWLGWYHAFDSPSQGLFTQGFAAVDFGRDRNDADYFYLDIGAGYRIPRRGCITAITPLLEVHWNAPLSHKEHEFTLTNFGVQQLGLGVTSLTNGTLAYRHQVNITGAVNFMIHDSKSVTLGVVVPTVGPRFMDFELVAQLNYFQW